MTANFFSLESLLPVLVVRSLLPLSSARLKLLVRTLLTPAPAKAAYTGFHCTGILISRGDTQAKEFLILHLVWIHLTRLLLITRRPLLYTIQRKMIQILQVLLFLWAANSCTAYQMVARRYLNIGYTAALNIGHLPYIKAIDLH